jgi:hypothetical protein
MNGRGHPWAAGTLILVACTGTIGEGPPAARSAPAAPGRTMPGMATPETPPAGERPVPPAEAGAGRLRLLTRSQIENSLRDLLGPIELGELAPESNDNLPSIGATYAAMTDTAVDLFHAAIKAMLAGYFADPARRQAVLGGCTPASPADDACYRRFVTGFGRRAWRRSLTTVEIERYTRLAMQAAQATRDVYGGLLYATAGLLESPHFTYRVELGQPDARAGGRFRYTGHELGSRLSYFLWNTTPDAELLAAADSGQLDRPEGVRAQVTRLLQSPRAQDGIANFARELLDLEEFAHKTNGDERFTTTVRAAMIDELARMYGAHAASGDFLDILDTRQTFVTPELAALYGIGGVTAAAGAPATYPAAIPRAGILGTAGFLTMTTIDKVNETSPTARGLFVNEKLLCRDIPPPPPNLDTTLKPPPPGTVLTKRETLTAHRADPGCAACHGQFDPLGFAFESFDWAGVYRTREPNGKPVDTTGTFEGVAFANAAELVAQLKQLPDAQLCLVTNLFRYAAGHMETAADQATIAAWNSTFGGQQRVLSRFLVELASSSAFAYVSPAP